MSTPKPAPEPEHVPGTEVETKWTADKAIISGVLALLIIFFADGAQLDLQNVLEALIGGAVVGGGTYFKRNRLKITRTRKVTEVEGTVSEVKVRKQPVVKRTVRKPRDQR